MKRLAILFAVAVVTPSLVLAWLALRSLHDQQFILERQQSLLCQGIADTLARNVAGVIEERQREFGAQVETLLATNAPEAVAAQFDERLRGVWVAARVGFVVSFGGVIYSPSPQARTEARQFRLENDEFLRCRASAEVYSGNVKGGNQVGVASSTPNAGGVFGLKQPASGANPNLTLNNASPSSKLRSVAPQQQMDLQQATPPIPQGVIIQGINVPSPDNNRDNLSRLTTADAEFCQLVGDATEGTVARFLQNRLNVMLWYRAPRAPELVFGALLDLTALREHVKPMVRLDPSWGSDLAVALLDDGAKPVAAAPADFKAANWKRPFVATEVGEALPHWELTVYLRNPDALGHAARTARLTLALLVGVLMVAIAVGSWLIVGDVRRQLALARQKTDFVSNVSHELKTPLTSIRMFAELLAEGRAGPEKQRNYLGIITAEAARLTRLINNVLDFARLDRGEKRFELQPCDLTAVVGETLDSFRPHLESAGFTLDYAPPAASLAVRVDRDAVAQVLVNLLSNAEKYSNGSREISVSLRTRNGAGAPAGVAELSVLDRGPGVPRGCEERIFEQFFRVHDSLAGGVQGSGLGLTLARQIARAHGGDVVYAPREGGGSCFALRLPLAEDAGPTSA
ncbi:MAG TPA: HAMP domain-containing sensor histidine kinase [Verrucomicrobiae bacterium]|jgi:signal transduction histidine kinase